MYIYIYILCCYITLIYYHINNIIIYIIIYIIYAEYYISLTLLRKGKCSGNS